MTALPRLGRIPYLNCLPLDAGLEATGAIDAVEPVAGTPAELARRLRRGELDIAPLSLIEYLRDTDRYLLLPGLAIGAEGAVRSVQLVSRVAPTGLRGPVAMTAASATSQVLLALLLSELWNVRVDRESRDVEFPNALDHAESALLIGDDALGVHAARPAGLHLTDLGAAWHELTGMPMVFAVWAARREYAREHPRETAAVGQSLASSLAWGLDHLDEVIEAAPLRPPLSAELLRDYFGRLDYGLGEPQRRGMREFERRARRHGLLADGRGFNEPWTEFVAAHRPELVEA